MRETGQDLSPDVARKMVIDVLGSIAPGPQLDALSPDDDLRETLGLDSLDFRSLVAGVSERSGRRIEEDDYERLTDLNGWISLLTEN